MPLKFLNQKGSVWHKIVSQIGLICTNSMPRPIYGKRARTSTGNIFNSNILKSNRISLAQIVSQI